MLISHSVLSVISTVHSGRACASRMDGMFIQKDIPS